MTETKDWTKRALYLSDEAKVSVDKIVKSSLMLMKDAFSDVGYICFFNATDSANLGKTEIRMAASTP